MTIAEMMALFCIFILAMALILYGTRKIRNVLVESDHQQSIDMYNKWMWMLLLAPIVAVISSIIMVFIVVSH